MLCRGINGFHSRRTCQESAQQGVPPPAHRTRGAPPFCKALHRLFDDLDETESEEHCKNLFAEFLKEAFYRDRNTINTKGKVDLAIYAGTKGGDKPQVLFEVKRPANLQEMFSDGNPNSKALHELILYHLRERFEGNNLELKHLAITNVRELYLFDARDFEAAFAKDRALVRAFEDSERGAGLALGAATSIRKSRNLSSSTQKVQSGTSTSLSSSSTAPRGARLRSCRPHTTLQTSLACSPS